MGWSDQTALLPCGLLPQSDPFCVLRVNHCFQQGRHPRATEENSPMLLVSHNIYCCCLGAEGQTSSAAEGETVLSGQFTGSIDRESS